VVQVHILSLDVDFHHLVQHQMLHLHPPNADVQVEEVDYHHHQVHHMDFHNRMHDVVTDDYHNVIPSYVHVLTFLLVHQ